MRKTCLVIALAFLLVQRASGALRFETGIYFGVRTINNGDLRKAFGNGLVYSPTASVFLAKNIFCGVAYEGGQLEHGIVGLSGEPASLGVSGLELFVGYQPGMRPFVPYIKAGYGSFKYTYTFDNPSLNVSGDTGTKGAVLVGAGFKVYVLDVLFLGGEIRYFPLAVKSLRITADFGGTRILGGGGVSF